MADDKREKSVHGQPLGFLSTMFLLGPGNHRSPPNQSGGTISNAMSRLPRRILSVPYRRPLVGSTKLNRPFRSWIELPVWSGGWVYSIWLGFERFTDFAAPLTICPF